MGGVHPPRAGFAVGVQEFEAKGHSAIVREPLAA
jgi:hypothetical protein